MFLNVCDCTVEVDELPLDADSVKRQTAFVVPPIEHVSARLNTPPELLRVEVISNRLRPYVTVPYRKRISGCSNHVGCY